MRNYFYSLSFLILLVGCNSGTSDAEKEYIKNLEEKNRQLEKELQDRQAGVSKETHTDSSDSNAKKSKNYFRIGSTEDEVLDVMGDPTSLTNIGSYAKIYFYDNSTVTFKNGKVDSYDNNGNLKIKVRD